MCITYQRTDADTANQLYATADADNAGADDRRSVSGWAVMLAGAMISWASKRQPVTAISSTESEFYSVSLCGLDCMYLRCMMDKKGLQAKWSNANSTGQQRMYIFGQGIWHVQSGKAYRHARLSYSRASHRSHTRSSPIQDCRRRSAVRYLHKGLPKAGI